MNHPKNLEMWSHDEVVGELRPDDAGEAIADLRYDSLQQLLEQLATALVFDAAEDRAAGREKLATELEWAKVYILRAARNIEKAWKICEPHEGG